MGRRQQRKRPKWMREEKPHKKYQRHEVSKRCTCLKTGNCHVHGKFQPLPPKNRDDHEEPTTS